MTRRGALALACVLAAASGAAADDGLASRPPTPEERRMMDLQLAGEGFDTCLEVRLVDSRWSCLSLHLTSGARYRLLLSNFDFAIVGRRLHP